MLGQQIRASGILPYGCTVQYESICGGAQGSDQRGSLTPPHTLPPFPLFSRIHIQLAHDIFLRRAQHSLLGTTRSTFSQSLALTITREGLLGTLLWQTHSPCAIYPATIVFVQDNCDSTTTLFTIRPRKSYRDHFAAGLCS